MDVDWFKRRKRELGITDDDVALYLNRDRTIANKLINGVLAFDLQYVDGFATAFKVTREEVLLRVGAFEVGTREQTVMMPVSLPNVDRLSTMMSGMLRSVGLPDVADEYSERLARLLPIALARSVAELEPARNDAAKPLDAEARLLAIDGPDSQQ